MSTHPEPGPRKRLLVDASVLAGLLALTLAVGRLGAGVTAPALETWYRGLAKPAWTPPDLAFPIVWTALYVLMAVAAWLVWRAGGVRGARWPLALWAVQLALNAAWSQLFFGLRRPGLALIDLGALLIAIAATIWAFWPHSRVAAGLLAPYLAWTAYAFALNAAIVWMNP